MIRPPAASSGGQFGDGGTPQRLAVRRAALPLIERDGFDGVTAEALARAAGFSRRSFFRLFAGKHQVISCDHELYHAEVLAHLLHHPDDQSPGRAAAAMTLVVDSLSAVRMDAERRAGLLAASPILAQEEGRRFQRYQETLAQFLTEDTSPRTTIEAEMTAAAIVVGARVAVRDWLADPSITATDRFTAATRGLTTPLPAARRRVVIMDTVLTAEEIRDRLT